ncbi:class F sortase [Candidatus Parcubacteria bacterium]|nr:class F sortase [Candidatus Parcubacteria bacterium]
MDKKQNKKRIGQSISMGSLIVAAALFVNAVFGTPNTEYFASLLPDTIVDSGSAVTSAVASLAGVKEPKPKPKVKVPVEPAYLKIPSIDLDADVQYVGKTTKGTMSSPTNYTDAGWYRAGPVPGSVGSAVMDGHVDNGFALPGVFKHLSELQAGDDVYVVRNDGKKLHFKVTDVKIFPGASAPTDLIFSSSDGKAHLNLITCSGDWIKESKTYDARLVVFTTLVD